MVSLPPTRSRAAVTTFTVLCLSCPALIAAGKPCVAAGMQDLATVWVGETVGEYVRLKLDPDGVGLLTVQWIVGRPAKAYRVTRTVLSDRRLNVSLEPVDDPRESLYLRGTACRGLLTVQIGSKSPEFKMELWLQPYSTLQDRLRAVTDRAERSQPTRIR